MDGNGQQKGSSWITRDLEILVRNVFEDKYNRPLTDGEVFEVTTRLAAFTENYLKIAREKIIKRGIARKKYELVK